MKKQLISFFAGIGVALMLFCTAPVFADSVAKVIEVYENTVNIIFKGSGEKIDNFLYNGTTYVPLRQVSEMLGFDISWDEATRDITIDIPISDSEVALTINGSPITYGKYRVAYNSVKNYYKNMGKEPSVADIKKELETSLVQVAALKQDAEKNNFKLSESDKAAVNANLDATIASSGEEAFNEYLKATGYTKDTYLLDLYDNTLINKYVSSIYTNEKIVKVSEEDINKYYTDNKEQYKGDTLLAKHILIKTINDDGSAMSAEEVKKAEETINDILKKIKNGSSFDTLMKKYTQDPGTETNPDGYYFGKGEMVKEFEDAAFALKKGQVSDVVKSAYGFHIIKLVDSYSYRPLESVAGGIEEILREQKLDTYIDEIIKSAVVVRNEEIISSVK